MRLLKRLRWRFGFVRVVRSQVARLHALPRRPDLSLDAVRPRPKR